MIRIQVEILALLTTRLDELTMEIGMRRGGVTSESTFNRSSIKTKRRSTSLFVCFCLPHETERFAAVSELTT